jgi:hypothetical protein
VVFAHAPSFFLTSNSLLSLARRQQDPLYSNSATVPHIEHYRKQQWCPRVTTPFLDHFLGRKFRSKALLEGNTKLKFPHLQMHQKHAILPTQQTSAGRKENNSDGREGNSDGAEEKTTAMTTRVQNIHPSFHPSPE